MSKLSPAAQAVLTAVTQQEYCLDPSEIPTEAARIGYALVPALRTVADQVALMRPHGGRAWTVEQANAYDALTKASNLLNTIADEMEALK